MQFTAPHTFHIPVMGLAFTMDSPIKVARFGISSVISIIEDNLIEKMRSYYYPKINEAYYPITNKEEDYRAKRITDYLNLVNRIVQNQIEKIKRMSFETGVEINKYFEMIPDGNDLKRIYEQKKLMKPSDKQKIENWLRKQIVPGTIDVNIMTKIDRNNKDKNGNEIEDGSDAVVSLRGYAKSNLCNSSVILSAGMNPRLFSYIEKLGVFYPDHNGTFKKKVTLKVSDYRSALIQGKILAKKGIWISEFRIESGLNCGGHAFATQGYLIGPILEEFKSKKDELVGTLFNLYNQALEGKGRRTFKKPHQIKISYQGGLGTFEEDSLIRSYYGLDSTGWGTPFLLVPEATTVDSETMKLLCKAKQQDVILSKNSPLGVPFHYLKGTSSEKEKLSRIKKGNPGSPCTEKFLVSSTEFSKEPICTASRKFQKRKVQQLKSLKLPKKEYNIQLQEILNKECLCIGLSNSAIKSYKLEPFKKRKAVNICPGPNIAYFTESVSLKRMIDHIYGRISIISEQKRPHMFVKELMLYIDYWSDLLAEAKDTFDSKRKAYLNNFYRNMISGIAYYRELIEKVNPGPGILKDKFESDLDDAETKLGKLRLYYLA